jgi:hypothetical protein
MEGLHDGEEAQISVAWSIHGVPIVVGLPPRHELASNRNISRFFRTVLYRKYDRTGRLAEGWLPNRINEPPL